MIDLMPFCSKEETRYYLMKPFTRGDFTYATNGHIMVRVPRMEEWPENEKAPDAARVMPSQDGITFLPFGKIAIPKPESSECEICSGRGVVHDCPDCHCVCDECAGKGAIEEQISVEVRGILLQGCYVALLATLPGVEIPDHPDTDVNKPMPFKFNGGDGALMPMKFRMKCHVAEPETFDAPAA